MATNLIYNHAEIERYLQKQMSATEMHAFEKAMMNDPFLADALEGFEESDASLANQHLSEISETINPKKEEAKVVGFGATTKWLRIAAMIIVVIGAGLITYNILNKPEVVNSFAATEQTLERDTISAIDEPLAQVQTPPKIANDNTTTAAPTIKQDAAISDNTNAAPLAMKKVEVNEDTTPLAMADPKLQRDELKSKESSIASARAPRQLSEVQANQTAQPKDGWVKFQAYVDKEVSEAKEKNSALNDMKVELEFSVDENGNVADIKILNASNTEVAKIAADILKKSPRWTPLANNARAKIVINF